MNNRRQFLQTAGILASGILLRESRAFAFNKNPFESERPPLSERKFTSEAIENVIKKLKKEISDPNWHGYLKIVFRIL